MAEPLNTGAAGRGALGLRSVLGGVLLAAVLLVLNLLSARHLNVRADLTETGEFTISDATKRVLRELDDVVNLKVYFTEDLPPQVATLPQQVRDLLDELRSYAGNKLRVEWIDPSSDPELENQMRSLGVQKVALTILEQDQQQIKDVYLGMALFYEDEQEVFPYLQGTATLEYDLVAALLKLTGERKVVGFTTGFSERDSNTEYQRIRQLLEQIYEVRDQDLAGGELVPPEVATLVVAGPRRSLDERALFVLDQFLMRGGRLILLIDPVRIGGRTLQASPLESGLDPLLEHWGVALPSSLALDWQANQSVTYQGQGPMGLPTYYTLPYPLWLSVLPENMSGEHPATAQLGVVTLPWAGPVELQPQTPEGLSYEPLLQTTQYASVSEQLAVLEPRYLQDPPPTEELSHNTLALAVRGSFESYFKDKPVPPIANQQDDTDELAEPQPESSEQVLERSPETQLVLVGNSQFAVNDYVGVDPYTLGPTANAKLLLNLVDTLTLGEDLIEIRTRSGVDRPLKVDLSETEKTVARLLNIVVMPLLVVAGGLGWRAIRRERRGRLP